MGFRRCFIQLVLLCFTGSVFATEIDYNLRYSRTHICLGLLSALRHRSTFQLLHDVPEDSQKSKEITQARMKETDLALSIYQNFRSRVLQVHGAIPSLATVNVSANKELGAKVPSEAIAQRIKLIEHQFAKSSDAGDRVFFGTVIKGKPAITDFIRRWHEEASVLQRISNSGKNVKLWKKFVWPMMYLGAGLTAAADILILTLAPSKYHMIFPTSLSGMYFTFIDYYEVPRRLLKAKTEIYNDNFSSELSQALDFADSRSDWVYLSQNKSLLRSAAEDIWKEGALIQSEIKNAELRDHYFHFLKPLGGRSTFFQSDILFTRDNDGELVAVPILQFHASKPKPPPPPPLQKKNKAGIRFAGNPQPIPSVIQR